MRSIKCTGDFSTHTKETLLHSLSPSEQEELSRSKGPLSLGKMGL